MVRVEIAALRRIPLNGVFTLRYQPYTPHAAILYRTDCDQGIFVDPEEDQQFDVTVRGVDIPKTGHITFSPSATSRQMQGQMQEIERIMAEWEAIRRK